MRIALSFVLMSVSVAVAQAPAPSPPSPAASMCGECGEVRSIRKITKQLGEAPTNEAKPSGLVATVPLGAGGGKPKIGSSERVGKEVMQNSTTWEVIVKLDDGNYRVVVSDHDPGLAQGDKVRLKDGQVLRRSD